MLAFTSCLLQKPIVANDHFSSEQILYDEDNGLTVTCYTGDYLNVGKILSEDQQYGQSLLFFTNFFPAHS